MAFEQGTTAGFPQPPCSFYSPVATRAAESGISEQFKVVCGVDVSQYSGCIKWCDGLWLGPGFSELLMRDILPTHVKFDFLFFGFARNPTPAAKTIMRIGILGMCGDMHGGVKW